MTGVGGGAERAMRGGDGGPNDGGSNDRNPNDGGPVDGMTIEPLDAAQPAVAAAIHAVQMQAYAQEAALLGARDFPPLRRRVEDVPGDAERYLVARAGDAIVGALGCSRLDGGAALEIVSLVVAPGWQRRGIASRLLGAAIDLAGDAAIDVSTGAANAPALALYAAHGFVERQRSRVGPERLEIVALRRPRHTRDPMLPFDVLRLDHLVLRVADLERSIAFYRALLGCAVVRRRDDLGLVHLRAGVSMIDLISIDGALGRAGGAAPGAQARNVDHLCLRIEPYDAAAIERHLAAHQVACTGRAERNYGAEGEGPSIYFADPDGNQIELKGPAVAA